MGIERIEPSHVSWAGAEADVAVWADQDGTVRGQPRSPRIAASAHDFYQACPPATEAIDTSVVGAAENQHVMRRAGEHGPIG